MNLEKDKKLKITKQKNFIVDWLSDPLFQDWLRKDKNVDAVARCLVYSKTISLSTACRSAVGDHGDNAKDGSNGNKW